MTGTSKRKPVKRFRVYVTATDSNPCTGPYIYINVWRTRQHMHEYRPDIAKQSPGFEALFTGYDRYNISKDGVSVKLSDFGEMNFHMDSLRVGIISHESAHAAIEWCRNSKLDPRETGPHTYNPDSPEERFAWVLGNITREICWEVQPLMNQYYKRKHENKPVRSHSTGRRKFVRCTHDGR